MSGRRLIQPSSHGVSLTPKSRQRPGAERATQSTTHRPPAHKPLLPERDQSHHPQKGEGQSSAGTSTKKAKDAGGGLTVTGNMCAWIAGGLTLNFSAEAGRTSSLALLLKTRSSFPHAFLLGRTRQQTIITIDFSANSYLQVLMIRSISVYN